MNGRASSNGALGQSNMHAVVLSRGTYIAARVTPPILQLAVDRHQIGPCFPLVHGLSVCLSVSVFVCLQRTDGQTEKEQNQPASIRTYCQSYTLLRCVYVVVVVRIYQPKHTPSYTKGKRGETTSIGAHSCTHTHRQTNGHTTDLFQLVSQSAAS